MGDRLNLVDALRVENQPRLAFVGSGGKTTAMFQLAREMLEKGSSSGNHTVIVTATTHLGTWQVSLADHPIQLGHLDDLKNFPRPLPEGVVLFTGFPGEDERLAGLSEPILSAIYELAELAGLPLLIEADGARRKPLKAPAEHEPPIPGWVDAVVVVSGLKGLGKPLSPEWVHRPELFSLLTGLPMGELVGVEHLARELLHLRGGLKNIPPAARKLALLNQADTANLRSAGAQLAERLLGSYAGVIVASLAPEDELEDALQKGVCCVFEPVAGIILAAGASSRFGAPKQLLEWRGEALLRWPIRAALEASLTPVVVVLGCQAEAIENVIDDLPVEVVLNRDWQSGQSSSIRVGLQALPPEVGSAIFLLADQPKVQETILRSLSAIHAETLAAVVAPLVDGQRGNPVLFDRRTFADLGSLKGDIGGKALFSRYPVTWLPWHETTPLLDIDQPDDYQRLMDEDL